MSSKSGYGPGRACCSPTDLADGSKLRDRYSVGVQPSNSLNARLKGGRLPKPASSAIVRMGTARCAGSASAARASAKRKLLR